MVPTSRSAIRENRKSDFSSPSQSAKTSRKVSIPLWMPNKENMFAVGHLITANIADSNKNTPHFQDFTSSTSAPANITAQPTNRISASSARSAISTSRRTCLASTRTRTKLRDYSIPDLTNGKIIFNSVAQLSLGSLRSEEQQCGY